MQNAVAGTELSPALVEVIGSLDFKDNIACKNTIPRVRDRHQSMTGNFCLEKTAQSVFEAEGRRWFTVWVEWACI